MASRIAMGSAVVALNVILIVLAYLSGAWLLPLGGITFLPVLWMCVTNKPLWYPKDMGFSFNLYDPALKRGKE